jgi:glycosyltransferase involved in cell wall biosynthesis
MKKIVHLFPTENVYGLLSDSYKPDVVLDNTDQGIVGIWREHWVNLLSDAVANETKDYEIEIWQPDNHAKKIYTHKFENGIVHNLYPNNVEDDKVLGKVAVAPFLDRVEQLKNEQPIVHLHEFGNPLTRLALKYLSPELKNILLLQYGGATYLEQSRHGKNLIRRFSYLIKSFEERKLLAKVKSAVVMYQKNADQLRKVYKNKITLATMGIECNYWKPEDKKSAREKFNIAGNKKVLLSASMLMPKKQIDLLIKAMLQIEKTDSNLDYLLLIVGGGNKQYEEKLKSMAHELIQKDKVKFLGRVDNQDLLGLYNASDLFLLLSSGEGSPVSIMKAHSCELPVITTDFGEAPEICRKQNVGYVVNNNWSEWSDVLKAYLKNELEVKPMTYKTATEIYDWRSIAKRFINIYKEI